MNGRNAGILHPGEMGVAVAATLKNSGYEVWWASEGRSAETRRRATDAGLHDAGSIADVCARCEAIISVCPPEFAEEMAREIAGQSFRGLYIDANAVSPPRARRIGQTIEAAGARFVDGCIIGLPARSRGETWIYFSGEHAEEAAGYFSTGPLEAEVLKGEIGKASALKMVFAAYTKGVAALRASVLGAAEELGVLPDLERQWGRSGPSFAGAVESIQHVAPKAWRFVAEMREIAETFEAAGMPPGFHRAAGEIFARLAPFKGAGKIGLEEALRQLHESYDDRNTGTRRHARSSRTA
jgi:3-hydroxyisobutyrate dehydrogenase-like beta-hydroxyacid dehydrogenase